MRTTVLNLNLKDVLNHTLNNKLFNYYISIITKDIEMLENDVPVVLHNDFYDLKDEIEELRKNEITSYEKKIRNYSKFKFIIILI